MSRLITLIIALLCSLAAKSQTYYHVTHGPGNATYNGNVVTVDTIGSVMLNYGTSCGVSMPYLIGIPVNQYVPGGYKFRFSQQVQLFRMLFTVMHDSERISVYINGVKHNITTQEISAYTGSCNTYTVSIANNGDLRGVNTSNAQLDISGVGNVDSIRVMHNGGHSGCGFKFEFANDTAVILQQPFNDTLLCAGDTVHIPYTVTKKFKSGNVFTAQLSNASGSFSSPTNIGTITSDTNGTFTWVVPGAITPGAGYRIRVVAANPSRTSGDNGINIAIGNTAVAKPIAANNGPVCSSDTLHLSATCTTSGVSYKWSGPNSFNASIQSPSIPNPVPINSGDYIVTAYIFGCSAMDTTTVAVYSGTGPGSVTATANAPICMNDTLKLFGTATGSSITFSWSGPNSYSSNTQNPVIPNTTTTMSGNYILYADNGTCVSRDTIVVDVKPRPANFTAVSNSPVCTGSAINFTASSSSTGVTYAWSGPNGFNTTSATPFINGAGSVHDGDYYVTATLNGCSLKDTLPVLTKALPNKPVAGSNSAICAAETLNLTATSTTTGVTYSWTGPGSYTSNTQNPSISNTTTSMSGNYIVTATLNGCVRKDTTAVQVKPLPTAVTTSNNGPVCAGDTLFINTTASSTGATYAWVGPNNFSSNTMNIYIANSTAVATGWYIVSAELNGCSIKDSTMGTVNPTPTTPTISYNNPICLGETLQLNASNISGATYSWTGANNYSAATQNPTRTNMQFGDTGTYKVTATVNGCTSAESSMTVNMNVVPFVVIFPTPGDSICVGDLASFTALPNNYGGTPKYQWLVNGIPAGTNSTSFSSSTLNNGDAVRRNMTEYTKCYSPYTDASNDVDMKVLPWLTPSVTITASPNRTLNVDEYVTFTAQPVNGGNSPKYQWKRNGQNVQGATSAVWSANTINDNDIISVELISNYKCPQPVAATSNKITVHVNTGIGGIYSNINKLNIHPNPNSGDFTLTGVATPNELMHLEVVNALGQAVYKKQLTPEKNNISHNIELGNVASGIYLLRININNQLSSIRFLVEH